MAIELIAIDSFQCEEENLLDYGQECTRINGELEVGLIENLTNMVASPRRGGLILLIGSPESGLFWFFLILSIVGTCCCRLAQGFQNSEEGPGSPITPDDDL